MRGEVFRDPEVGFDLITYLGEHPIMVGMVIVAVLIFFFWYMRGRTPLICGARGRMTGGARRLQRLICASPHLTQSYRRWYLKISPIILEV